MCGIVGFSTAHEAYNEADLENALAVLSHRGPDANGLWISDNSLVGLGHCRLSILDLSDHGSQPMKVDERYTLVYNGEIYNYLKLKSDLIERGYQFKGTGDTEVVLKWFIEHGINGISNFNGIFALAIWDNVTGELIVVRDRMGVKPVYFAAEQDKFVFASELKSICDFINWDWNIDIQALTNYMSFIYNPDNSTPNNTIKKLKPGQILKIQDGKIIESTEYNINKDIGKNLKTKGRSYYIDGVRKHLRDAVSRQMVSDVEVGCFLSGGLDSTAICHFAKNDKTNLQCFTISAQMNQEPGLIDDLPYAKQAADHLGVKLNILETSSDTITQGLESMVYHLDEPIADPAAINTYLISKFARQMGIKVLLSGAGGDDLFTGYRRHQALASEKYWEWIPLPVRKLVNNTLNNSGVLSGSRRLKKLSDNSLLEPQLRMVAYHLWSSNDLLESLIHNDFREYIESGMYAEPMLSHLRQLPNRVNRMEKMLSLEQRFFLAEHNLIYADKMSMAAGVEVRVPFLDHDLVNFASTIPAQYKQRLFEGKWVLKKAMEPYLPKSLIYRPKTGFGVPLRSWMQNELSEMKNDLLSEETIKSRGIFKHERVTQLIRDTASNKVDGSYTLLSLMCIELWMQKFSKLNMSTKY